MTAVYQFRDEECMHAPLPDPRSTSSQSLAPSRTEDPHSNKRRLLIIYIHGFIGNEDSFRSFPYHLHVSLKERVAATHVVHSKIYPRYKTYRAFQLARDNFSKWLSAHEDDNTDVILVGHSMGGLLAAEVVLMKDKTSGSKSTRKHRILGTVNLDVPFLGAQNRVYLAGLLSPFRSKSELVPTTKFPDQESNLEVLPWQSPIMQGSTVTSSERHSSSNTATLLAPTVEVPDPNFNPLFANDILIQKRDRWRGMLHFAQKHADEGFFHASFRHWKAHFEFGSCLLNGQKLKAQYNALRKLDIAGPIADGATSSAQKRVHFVQFYTASQKGLAISRRQRRSPFSESENHLSTYSGADSVRFPRSISDIEAGSLYTDDSFATKTSAEDELFFCKLAKQENREVDPLWKKVQMATNDEINAHTSLFLPGPHYSFLVGSTTAEILGWMY